MLYTIISWYINGHLDMITKIQIQYLWDVKTLKTAAIMFEIKLRDI